MKTQKSFTIKEIKDKMGRYCAYQDRCHFDVENKLNEFFLIPEAKDEIFIYLIQENFLNEERFVENFVLGKFNQKNWGKIKIINELRKRNITQKMINDGISLIDSTQYLSVIEKLIIKKLRTLTEKNDYKRKGKVILYMQQKGFEYNLISEIYDSILDNKSIG